VSNHRLANHAIVTLSLKPVGEAPGDASAEAMEAAADLAERFSGGELRVSHHQNLVLPHVRRAALAELFVAAEAAGLATPNKGLATDIIACPGGDYCALANARSIPLAKAIQAVLAPKAEAIGPLRINVSGCINACAHHHVGHIGVMGVDKKDEEWFQLFLGGRSDSKAALGTMLGKAVHRDTVPAIVAAITDHYLASRTPGEDFIDTVARLGTEPFRTAATQVLETAA
jgi:sulfite reductase (NADPH) hemoprotein beta-component